MAIEVPAAHVLDGQTGEYRVTGANDAATSGGDIGAQIPIFPVVWVSKPPPPRLPAPRSPHR